LPEVTAKKGLLILPRIRIQNANAISAPMTWGFPSMTAFLGLMWALERKLSKGTAIIFQGVSVICHDFEPQVETHGFISTFHLTRNPLGKDEKPKPIVEEGRTHIDLTLVFAVDGKVLEESLDERNKIAQRIMDLLARMRVAGGTVIPNRTKYRHKKPEIIRLDENAEAGKQQFQKLCRGWLPGFTLVSREDLLLKRWAELHSQGSKASILDAWLDLSRVNWRAVKHSSSISSESDSIESEKKCEWQSDHKGGWIVPIPVGYAALSEVYAPGTVGNARDHSTSFCFVESIYSIGEWISPHRLHNLEQMLWYAENNDETGLYKCTNNFITKSTALAIK
jgi:CRISPR-associated protein Csy2